MTYGISAEWSNKMLALDEIPFVIIICIKKINGLIKSINPLAKHSGSFAISK